MEQLGLICMMISTFFFIEASTASYASLSLCTDSNAIKCRNAIINDVGTNTVSGKVDDLRIPKFHSFEKRRNRISDLVVAFRTTAMQRADGKAPKIELIAKYNNLHMFHEKNRYEITSTDNVPKVDEVDLEAEIGTVANVQSAKSKDSVPKVEDSELDADIGTIANMQSIPTTNTIEINRKEKSDSFSNLNTMEIPRGIQDTVPTISATSTAAIETGRISGSRDEVEISGAGISQNTILDQNIKSTSRPIISDAEIPVATIENLSGMDRSSIKTKSSKLNVVPNLNDEPQIAFGTDSKIKFIMTANTESASITNAKADGKASLDTGSDTSTAGKKEKQTPESVKNRSNIQTSREKSRNLDKSENLSRWKVIRSAGEIKGLSSATNTDTRRVSEANDIGKNTKTLPVIVIRKKRQAQTMNAESKTLESNFMSSDGTSGGTYRHSNSGKTPYGSSSTGTSMSSGGASGGYYGYSNPGMNSYGSSNAGTSMYSDDAPGGSYGSSNSGTGMFSGGASRGYYGYPNTGTNFYGSSNTGTGMSSEDASNGELMESSMSPKGDSRFASTGTMETSCVGGICSQGATPSISNAGVRHSPRVVGIIRNLIPMSLRRRGETLPLKGRNMKVNMLPTRIRPNAKNRQLVFPTQQQRNASPTTSDASSKGEFLPQFVPTGQQMSPSTISSVASSCGTSPSQVLSNSQQSMASPTECSDVNTSPEVISTEQQMYPSSEISDGNYRNSGGRFSPQVLPTENQMNPSMESFDYSPSGGFSPQVLPPEYQMNPDMETFDYSPSGAFSPQILPLDYQMNPSMETFYDSPSEGFSPQVLPTRNQINPNIGTYDGNPSEGFSPQFLPIENQMNPRMETFDDSPSAGSSPKLAFPGQLMRPRWTSSGRRFSPKTISIVPNRNTFGGRPGRGYPLRLFWPVRKVGFPGKFVFPGQTNRIITNPNSLPSGGSSPPLNFPRQQMLSPSTVTPDGGSFPKVVSPAQLSTAPSEASSCGTSSSKVISKGQQSMETTAACSDVESSPQLAPNDQQINPTTSSGSPSDGSSPQLPLSEEQMTPSTTPVLSSGGRYTPQLAPTEQQMSPSPIINGASPSGGYFSQIDLPRKLTTTPYVAGSCGTYSPEVISNWPQNMATSADCSGVESSPQFVPTEKQMNPLMPTFSGSPSGGFSRQIPLSGKQISPSTATCDGNLCGGSTPQLVPTGQQASPSMMPSDESTGEKLTPQLVSTGQQTSPSMMPSDKSTGEELTPQLVPTRQQTSPSMMPDDESTGELLTPQLVPTGQQTSPSMMPYDENTGEELTRQLVPTRQQTSPNMMSSDESTGKKLTPQLVQTGQEISPGPTTCDGSSCEEFSPEALLTGQPMNSDMINGESTFPQSYPPRKFDIFFISPGGVSRGFSPVFSTSPVGSQSSFEPSSSTDIQELIEKLTGIISRLSASRGLFQSPSGRGRKSTSSGGMSSTSSGGMSSSSSGGMPTSSSGGMSSFSGEGKSFPASGGMYSNYSPWQRPYTSYPSGRSNDVVEW